MDRKITETIKRRYNRISIVFDWMDRMIKEDWRKNLISRVQGEVLEVGVGTGANLPFFNRRTMDNIEQAGFIVEEKIELMGTIMRMLILHPNKKPNII